ncbi:MAG: B12-binding domain-containing radical SAM protein [Planctomycetota bacterium]|jgi:radical SAM superfamily enzyme YgiQ (UPF0313 family)
MSRKRAEPAIILVADRTLSANYKVLFEGIFATMQTTKVPEIAMRRFVSPKVAADSQGRAMTAALGIRRLESALLKYTDLTRDDVVCTTPEALASLIGPWVKIVAFSSSDPLGRGMSNTTTTNFWKGELYTSYWTRRMLEGLSEAKKKYGFKIVAGGAGAWQWAYDQDERERLGIDVVFEGYFEDAGPGLFNDILNGRNVERNICEKKTVIDKVQPIKRPSMLGIIELSRGCGRGCKFCSMSSQKMEHLPVDTILSDIELNVAGGIRSVVSSSEDFFRYGAVGLKPDFAKLRDLLYQMKQVKGLSFMQIDHGNVTSVMQLSDEELTEVRELLTWEKKSDYLWVNMGVESANGELVAANCPGKISPYRAEDWEDIVREAAEKMTRNGFYSVFSVILGLPGETPDDIARTLKLCSDLGKKRAVIFPIFYEPMSDAEIKAGNRFTLGRMRADHLELYRTCYEINFRAVPRLFVDNQHAGGVSWLKIAMMQLLGKGEVFSWRRTFKRLERQLAGSQPATAEEAKYARRSDG